MSSLEWRNRVWIVIARALLLGVAWREPKLYSTCIDARTRAGTSWSFGQMSLSSRRIHLCEPTITKRCQSIFAWVQPRLPVATLRLRWSPLLLCSTSEVWSVMLVFIFFTNTINNILPWHFTLISLSPNDIPLHTFLTPFAHLKQGMALILLLNSSN